MSIADDIRSGALVPVAVFGGPSDCPHCGKQVPWAFGLCDRFSKFTPGGSDCNRAEFFLLRPNDLGTWVGDPNPASEQDLAEIRKALDEVLDDE